VFFLLQLTIGSTSDEDPSTDDKFRPPELLFLLKDLAAKVGHSLVESKTKKGFPGQNFEIWETARSVSI
jgi:hypothetical protein